MRASEISKWQDRLRQSKDLASKSEYTLALALVTGEDADHHDCAFGQEHRELAMEFSLHAMLCHACLLHRDESTLLARRVLQHTSSGSAEAGLAQAVLGWEAFLRGDRQLGATQLNDALSVLRAENRDRWIAVALKWLSQIYQADGVHSDAIQCLYESLGAARRAGESALVAEVKMHLSRVYRKIARLDESISLSHEAFSEFSRVGGLTFVAHTAIDISVLARTLGRLHESLDFANRALAIGEETRHEICRISALISISRAEVLLSGQFSESETSTLLDHARSIGAVHQVSLMLEDFGDHFFTREAFAQALAKYEESLAEIEKVAPRGEFAGELSWRIGLCHVRLGDLERAHTWITRGLDLCTKSGDLKELALTLRAQGHLFLAQGNIDLGVAKLNDALDRLARLGVVFEVAKTRIDLAKTHRDHTRDRLAHLTHLDAAESSFRTMGSNVGLGWVESLRAMGWPESDGTPASTGSVDEVLLALDANAPLDESDCKSALADLTLAIQWKSSRYLEALGRLQRFATSTQPILVMGESGAGKTAFAEVAHRRGPGRRGPFIVLNCASLPDTLLESELFGSIRGAFTGADRDRAGLIRAAGHGTIFLDEIDKASPSFQATILHVLDRGEVRPVGGQAFYEVRARFVFAANRDLGELSSR